MSSLYVANKKKNYLYVEIVNKVGFLDTNTELYLKDKVINQIITMKGIYYYQSRPLGQANKVHASGLQF